MVGGAIHFGASPTACGTATTANTDTINITGAAGSVETLTIDQTGGGLAPGGTAETTGTSEIELAVNLGDASDVVVVKGRTLADTLAVGTKGVSFNNDTDVDITFTPAAELDRARGRRRRRRPLGPRRLRRRPGVPRAA